MIDRENDKYIAENICERPFFKTEPIHYIGRNNQCSAAGKSKNNYYQEKIEDILFFNSHN
jgi:hypothetical protein